MEHVEHIVVRKVMWRVAPLLTLCYLISFIDKTNIGVAQLGMQKDLGLSDAAFGFGAGIFFVGYFLLEVPSNLALVRFGARRWIARIMVTWGVVVVLTALVQGETSFNIMRFLLGAAEAGFYPGALYFLAQWVPGEHRGKVIGLFLLANPVSTVIGAPLMGVLLDMHGFLGIDGWQWVFVITGLPALVMAVVVLVALPDSPAKAAWLTEPERQWLIEKMAAERAAAPATHGSAWRTLLDKRVLFLCLWFAAFPTAAYGLCLWLPTLIAEFDVSATVNGWLNAIPFFFAAVALYVWPRVAARSGNSYRQIAGCTLLGAVGLAGAAVSGNPVAQLGFISLAAVGMFAGQPIFWSIPSRLLVGAQAAAGLALINSVGNLGGFVGPYVVGAIKGATGSLSASMLFLAAVMVFAAVMAGVARKVFGGGPAAPAARTGNTPARTAQES
ncbi:MFS transporter [Streptomyces sp. NPDC102360]|uniref:MFS transporter n=1 Tax=Streptomyces sp. NPDC102360 TaxID=3366160 RepID=UPI00380A7512